ncbi:hypothetical protein SAMN05443144_12012 [Fodinibius roseus]|uniref:Uncharacterized protein n=1 Tax=Fodinibius roseus TaxID=1194090 RepID=A0A1M5HDW1_9BACT|nr:hypothetical protein [Fodinibius roseus]SHG14124.1 hypothetical protein SAMN05443144_12012 [Fodinibius roseus]
MIIFGKREKTSTEAENISILTGLFLREVVRAGKTEEQAAMLWRQRYSGRKEESRPAVKAANNEVAQNLKVLLHKPAGPGARKHK